MSAKHRSLGFAVLAIIGAAALCEALATAGVAILEKRLPFPDPRLYLAEPVSVERLARNFDAELGWIAPYETPFGERPRATDYGRPLVSAFGDSFTHGDEVSASETWEEALAAELGGDVFNFGVGGYGMDQTLLRFEREQPRRPTLIAIFAFISGDLELCYQRYWNFHNPDSLFPMTKPRLLLRGGALELMPNPVRTPEELHAGVNDVAFIERLAREDPSFNPFGLPPITRPYLLLLARPSVWRGAFAAAKPRNPWSDPDAVKLAEQILLRFARVAHEHGARPVILHLPLHSEMAKQLERGEEPVVSAQLRAICERHRLDCILPLLAEPAGPMGARWDYFVGGRRGGHYSALGNRWIARVIAEHLRQVAPALVDEAPDPAAEPLDRDPAHQGKHLSTNKDLVRPHHEHREHRAR